MLPRTPDKALACYGALCETTRQVYLSWCWQRPNGDETITFLKLLCSATQALRKRTLVVIWDNASWHVARKVKRWIRRYNQEAKQSGSPRLLVWALPKRSPWLNPIEARWMHAKRQVFEPSSQDLSAHELRRRVFAALNTRPFPWLPQYHP